MSERYCWQNRLRQKTVIRPIRSSIMGRKQPIPTINSGNVCRWWTLQQAIRLQWRT